MLRPIEPGFELLIDLPICKRGTRILEALRDTAPAGTHVTKRYAGKHSLLVLYGVGLQSRYAAMLAHKRRGGHVAMWDLGYWNREEGGMRVSIDHLHPTAAQMMLAPESGSRHDVELRSDAKESGPILLIGMGHKSAHMYGVSPYAWERKTLLALKKAYPGKQIAWRPKGRKLQLLPGTQLRHGMSIQEALAGCSLVVCRHSNVGIDACIAGVPVKCEDGAAAALYNKSPNPTPAERQEFLRRLGWWNWRPSEAKEAWNWMRHVTGV